MAQIVKLRRSSVSGQKPTNTNLQLGELAQNTTDGKIFLAKSGSGGPSIEELIVTNTSNTGSINLLGSVSASNFTGSFKGDGALLYNIPASGVTGLQLDRITSGNVSASISPSTGLVINTGVTITGSISATEFTGSGLGLTNVPFHVSGSNVDGGTYDKQFTKLQFDDSTGLNVSESVAGTAFISIGSHFRDIFVSGSNMLRATGSDAFEIIPEGGIEVTTSITDTNSNGYVKELRLSTTTLSSSLDTRIYNLSSSVVYQSQTSSMTVLSSSYALTASFALNAGAGAEGRTYIHTQSSASTTWTVTHNLGEKYPAIVVFDSSDNVIVPGTITAINDTSFTVTFPSAQTGKVSATVGGGLPFVSASFVDYVLAVNNDVPYWKGGVISGSAQIILTGTTGYSTLSSSIATTTLNTQNRVDSIETKTGSYATTGSNLFIGTQTLSGSIIPSVDNLYDLGSSTHQWRDVYISSGSLYIDGTKVISSTTQELQITTDTGQSIKILEGGTDSIILQTADGDVELKSSGDGDILLDPTNGKILLKGTVEVLSGNKIQSSVGGTPVVFANDIVVSGSIELTGTIDGIDLTSFSSSVNTRLTNLESSGGSLNSFTSSANSRLNALETTSGSLNSYTSSTNIRLNSIETSTSSLNTFSSSTLTRLTSIETSTSSLNSFSSSTNNKLTSLETSTSSLNSYTSSNNTVIGTLQTSTGSLNSFTSSANGRLNSIEGVTGSIALLNTYTGSNNTVIGTLQTSTSSLNTFTSSTNTRLGVIESTTSSLNTFTSSANSRLNSLETASGSIRTDFNSYTSSANSRLTAIETATSSLNTFTSSAGGRLTSIEGVTGSISALNTYTGSNNTVIGTLQTATSSLNSYTSSNTTNISAIHTATSSLNSFTSSAGGRLNFIEGVTGSISALNTYTGSNTTAINALNTATSSLNSFTNSFNTAFGLSGTNVTVKGNLTVQGSTTQIDSTTVNIADNIIQLNGTGVTNAGLVVRDATAATLTSGSLLWDTTNDKWIAGPLGSEDDVVLRTATQTLTNKTISGASNTLTNIGNSSLTNSSITIAGTSTSLGGTISASTIGNAIGAFSGSAQVSFSGISGLPTLVSGSSQVSFGGLSGVPSGLVSGSSQVLVGTTIHSGAFFNGISVVSGSGQISFNGITDKPALVSGSSQISFGSISGVPSGLVSGSSQISFGSISGVPSGLVSGSSQISFGSISGLPSGLVSGSSQVSFSGLSGVPSGLVSGSSQISFGSISGVPSGLVSGSSQISIASTSGFATYINQALLTTSTPTFSTVSATTFTGALSGNATTATNSTAAANISLTGIASVNVNNGSSAVYRTESGTGAALAYAPVLHLGGGDTMWQAQGTYGSSGNGTLYFRQGYSGSWGNWLTMLSSANYNSYSPTLTGTGASGTWAISISGNANTASALTSMNISQFTNNSGYITGISFANVSSKPTTLSGYGITDALSNDSDSEQDVGGRYFRFNNGTKRINIDPRWNESGYDADMGVFHMYSTTAAGAQWGRTGIALYNGSAYQYITTKASTTGLFVNNTEVVTNSGTWGINVTGTAGNITAYTINQNLGTSNTVQFGSLGVGVSPALTVHFRGSGEMVRFENTSTASNQYCQLNMKAGNRNGYIWIGNENTSSWAGAGGLNIYTENGNIDLWSNAVQRIRLQTDGHLVPFVNNSYNLGSSSLGWANVYTNDLHLSNMNKPEGNDIDGTNGNWTIQEGAENLYIINNNNGKKFKISLEEI